MDLGGGRGMTGAEKQRLLRAESGRVLVGAVPGTGTDSTVAWNAALAAVPPGGVVTAAPGVYTLLGELSAVKDVTIDAPGVVWDFGQHVGWANATAPNPKALFTSLGALAGAPVTLGRDAGTVPANRRDLLSITRTGTTATATVVSSHGLVAGDYVWISGSGGTSPITGPSAQQKLYTVTINGALGDPTEVLSVPTASSFTYAVPADAAASMTGSGTVLSKGRIVVCPTATFTAGDMVMVGYNGYDVELLPVTHRRADASAEKIALGDLTIVDRIVNSGCMLVKKACQDDYTASGTFPASVQRIAPGPSVHLKGLGIRVRGSSLDPLVVSDRAILFDYLREWSVEGCTFTNIDLVGMEAKTSLNGLVADSSFSADQRNVAGRTTGKAYVQYAVSLGNGTDDVIVRGNVFHGFRHGVVQGSDPARPGITRNLSIYDNTFWAAWLGAISTHQGVDAENIHHNAFIGCHTAINIRWAEHSLVRDNYIFGCEFGILISKHWNGLVVEGNEIDRCSNAIQVSGPIAAVDAVGAMSLVGNPITACGTGINVIASGAGVVSKAIEVSRNRMRDIDGSAILLNIGAVDSATDGWSGAVTDNVIDDACLVYAGPAIRGINARDTLFGGNKITATHANMNRGILADGAGAARNRDVGNMVVGATVADVDFTVGGSHRSDGRDKEPVTIAAGVVAPRYTSRISYLQVDTEALAATDDLDTITGAYPDGAIIVVKQATSSRAVVVKHATGNIFLRGDASRSLTSTRHSITLVWSSTASEAYEVGYGSSSSAPDATTAVKGLVKLAGDLGGTALLPTVPGLATNYFTMRESADVLTVPHLVAQSNSSLASGFVYGALARCSKAGTFGKFRCLPVGVGSGITDFRLGLEVLSGAQSGQTRDSGDVKASVVANGILEVGMGATLTLAEGDLLWLKAGSTWTTTAMTIKAATAITSVALPRLGNYTASKTVGGWTAGTVLPAVTVAGGSGFLPWIELIP